MNLRICLAIGIAINILSVLPTESSAQSSSTVQGTTPGQIIKMTSDWNGNALLVQLGTTAPVVNPAGCVNTDYYSTMATDSGATLNHSLLVSAYMSHINVALVIQGCAPNGRPHIIAVAMPST